MLGEIAAIYRKSKKSKDINRFTEWICRPPAAVIVYFLRPLPITPNQVTFLSFAVACAAGAMLALLPGHLWLCAAVLVFEFSFVLDCADGQLARVRWQSSPLGHLLDFLMDEIKAMLIFACVAVRLWRESGSTHFLLAGLAGLFVLASALSLTSFMRRPEYGAPAPTAEGQPARIRRGSNPLGWARFALEHGARAVVHYPAYIWITALVNRMDLYFWAYAGVHLLYLGYAFLSVTSRLARFEPRPR